MIFFKDSSVNLDGVDRHIYHALAVAADIWERYGSDLWVTSVRDGIHPGGARPSFHPDGKAADLRTWSLPVNLRHSAAEELALKLGPDYDVLYERPGQSGEHVHIQYDPRS